MGRVVNVAFPSGRSIRTVSIVINDTTTIKEVKDAIQAYLPDKYTPYMEVVRLPYGFKNDDSRKFRLADVATQPTRVRKLLASFAPQSSIFSWLFVDQFNSAILSDDDSEINNFLAPFKKKNLHLYINFLDKGSPGSSNSIVTTRETPSRIMGFGSKFAYNP